MGLTDSEIRRFVATNPHSELFRARGGWRYAMRRSMQEVAPGVYLGPYAAARRSQAGCLRRHGVTHIVCVRQQEEARYIRPNMPEEFHYLTLDVADRPEEDIGQYFQPVNAFIDHALARGGKVLIHGNIGQSRSAALAVAYVVARYRLSAEAALAVVCYGRFCAAPNPGFMRQLREYAAHVRGACPAKRRKLSHSHD